MIPPTSIPVTKSYVDAMVTGMAWHGSKPLHPTLGDCYVDTATGIGYIWEGSSWVIFSDSPGAAPKPPFIPPSQEQLEKHPALKEAWEDFLVIKKLLGV